MNKYTVIVSGGNLEEDFVMPILENENTEFIIGVDKGLDFLYKHKIRPDYIVGDFDSVEEDVVTYFKEVENVPAKEFNAEKDFSDTEIALKFGLDLRRQHIIILGATGTRLDHVWANVQSLKMGSDCGCDVRILDRHNEISVHNESFTIKKEEAFGKYFSLFPLGGTVEGLTIKGAKYPLEFHALEPYNSLSVSNEFEEDEVNISFSYGTIILMQTRD